MPSLSWSTSFALNSFRPPWKNSSPVYCVAVITTTCLQFRASSLSARDSSPLPREWAHEQWHLSHIDIASIINTTKPTGNLCAFGGSRRRSATVWNGRCTVLLHGTCPQSELWPGRASWISNDLPRLRNLLWSHAYTMDGCETWDRGSGTPWLKATYIPVWCYRREERHPEVKTWLFVNVERTG